ncbi:4-hydroxyproline epimerase [Aureitalea marina]|uniref:Hydroxyproline-2-epimerase n=1 Tax=Aureitalea marina TaxID=930804 RepID=A0A2S7KLK2_9FLAO|nr:4-hydroxyproline epimerase [Aureitalea marina]PQB03478.1 hydroxyproline-2-epimerase [Aureitalea marina]
MSETRFKCIDAHTCGNPVRVVLTGKPELRGSSMSERRQHFLEEYDWIRTGLMFEPRGHDMMSGSLLYPPADPTNDVGVLFIETSGCLPMCGHGTIGTVTIAIEKGLVTPKEPGELRLETPAGLVVVQYQEEAGKVRSVTLTNVKSYLAGEGLTVDCPGLGELKIDVSYGGNFYAIVDPQENFSGVQDFTAGELIQFSQVVRKRLNEKYPDCFIHPEDPTIRDITHMLWTGNPIDPNSDGRNAVFYGDKAIDRSPCGTGTSARMAQLHAKGQLKVGQDYVHESFIGSTFTGRIVQETNLANHKAIIPSIKGWARIYGENTISIDPQDDPYAYGFQVI